MPQYPAVRDVLRRISGAPATAVRRTAEVRWFVPGLVPEQAAEWFAHLGPGEEEPRRTDVYLQTGDSSLNVKQRQGRLEVKQRLSAAGEHPFAARAAGAVERWKKWFSVTPPDLDDILAASHGELDWIEVGKARHRQHFDVEDGIRAVAPGPQRPAGCDLELTRLTVAGELWWTLSFEAFGPEDRVMDMLDRSAEHAFSLYTPRELDPEHSYGYAQWLIHVVETLKDGGPPAVV